MSEPNMRSAALRYAGAGVRVFPLNGKRPITENGFHDASADREQVERWWTEHPQAGIGTPDFDAVDVDLYKPACKETWEQIRPLIPQGTPHNRTGGGGLQFLFAPGTLKDGKIGPGVDSRYAGRNYVVLPPSRHPSGNRYQTVVDVMLRSPKPAPEFPHASGANSEFRHLREQMDAGKKITDGRNKAAWWRAVEILRTLPASTDPTPVRGLVQSWVNDNCAGNLDEVDVAKQVRGAVKFVASERADESTASRETAPERSPNGKVQAHSLGWQRLSGVEMRSIVFADKPLLQADAFHLIVGRKGMGKGTLLAEIASRVTRGELGSKRNVVWIGSEDSAAIDVKPRIVVAGGDPDRILIVADGWPQLPRDIDEIRQAMLAFGDVGMVAIDPVANHIGARNSNSDAEVRDAIAPLNGLADEPGCMVFGVRHLTEKECGQGALAAILGSSAWVQVPRAVLAVVRDDVDARVSHVQCIAGNRLPPGTPGRMFRIDGVLLPGLENEVTLATWIGDSAKDVEEMLTAKLQRASKSDAARELVLDILDAEGEQESDTLDARIAAETGLAVKTIKNVRVGLKDEGLLKAFPDKDEFGEIIRWLVVRTQAPRP